MQNKNILEYLKHGKRLIPLIGKKPIIENWVNVSLSEQELIGHIGNFGWALDHNDLVIDIDPRNGGFESWDKLRNEYLKEIDWRKSLIPTVNTPSGGLHVYLQLPEYFKGKIKKNIPQLPGIDFLSYGSQCVIVGSVIGKNEYKWVDDIFCEFNQNSCPKLLLDIISVDAIANNSELGDFDGLIHSSTNEIEEDQILEYLNQLDPSTGYEEWIRIGMALHDWDNQNGLLIWENWSKGGINYQEGATAKHWKSFKPGNGISIGTLIHLVKEEHKKQYEIEISDLIDKIKLADKYSLIAIIDKLPNQDINDIDREIVAKELQSRYKDVIGIRLPINEIRKKIKHNNEQVIETPLWCKNWIYVNSHSGFVNLKTMRLYKSEAFNLENGKYVPDGDKGGKPNANKFVCDNGYVPTVNSMAYLPTYQHQIVEVDNIKILNTFDFASIPVEDKEYTKGGLNAIKIIEKHIKLICESDENCNIFTQWLAHQIQYPGKQILWSPVIQAIQGIGKSFFGELLRVCLGDRNVGTVSPTQVISQFNGWATGVAVNVLEELRIVGHSRFEAVNALKPLITDRMIQINDKGVKQHMTYNTTNYICFTNYKDALPIDEDDRRWWIIFVNIQSLSEIETKFGISLSNYFSKLFDTLRNYPGQIRKWLLEYEISDEFLNIKQAPMTKDKMSMIKSEENNIEGLVEIKELISNGSMMYDINIISSPDLFNDFDEKYPEIQLSNRTKCAVLKKLGYMCHGKVGIFGEQKRFWTKKSTTNDEIRNHFLQKYTDLSSDL